MLDVNKYVRPGDKLKKVKGLVIHWPDYPGATAKQVYEVFEERAKGFDGYGATHKIIGLDGEIIDCIPEDELAYHVGSNTYTSYALHKFGTYPNNCTLGVEVCHTDKSGRMTAESFEALVSLLTLWCKKYKLSALDITTHHQIVGWKECPKWFTDHQADFEYLRFLVNINLGGT